MTDLTNGTDDRKDANVTLAGVQAQATAAFGQAKDKAREVSQQATQIVQHSASEFVGTARGLVSDASAKLQSTLDEQKSVGADWGSNLASAIRRAGQELEKDLPQATPYISRAADEVEKFSDAIRRRDVSELVGNVTDMARKQPTAFLAATVLAGFVAVRLFKTAGTAAGDASVSGPTDYSIG